MNTGLYIFYLLLRSFLRNFISFIVFIFYFSPHTIFFIFAFIKCICFAWNKLRVLIYRKNLIAKVNYHLFYRLITVWLYMLLSAFRVAAHRVLPNSCQGLITVIRRHARARSFVASGRRSHEGWISSFAWGHVYTYA